MKRKGSLGILLLGLLLTLTVGSASAARNDAPAPLPVGSDGRPVLNIDWNSFAPGEWRLLAVKPAGTSNWYLPTQLQISYLGPGIIQVGGFTTGNSSGGGTTTTTPRRLSSARRALGEGYGCDARGYPPSLVAPGVIQGNEDFTACFNVSTLEAEVGLEDSQTYSSKAWNTTWHYGNASFTAWSSTFECQGIWREWETVATNTYWSTDGQEDIWGGTSPWGGAFSC